MYNWPLNRHPSETFKIILLSHQIWCTSPPNIQYYTNYNMQLSSSHSEGTLLSSPIMQYYTNHKILFIPSGSSLHMKHHHCCPQYITAQTTIQCKLQHNCLNPFRIKPSCKTSPLLSSMYHCKDYNSVQTAIIIIMYIYHVLINALSAHLIHINLNVIFCTHVEHSPIT